jgi:hypothetical protein
LKTQESIETAAPKTEAAVPTEKPVSSEAEGAVPQGKAPLTQEEQQLLDQSEQTIRVGLGQFVEVGSALIEISDHKLYRVSFDTFEDYCRQQWNLSDDYAYRLINAAKCVTVLKAKLTSQDVTVFPTNEAQVRPLLDLEPKEQAKAWLKVLKDTAGNQITAKEVKGVVDGLTGKPEGKKTVTPKARLEKTEQKLTRIEKLVTKAKGQAPFSQNTDFLQILEEILKVIKRGRKSAK